MSSVAASKKTLNVLFIFDANYLSPALVSVASFFEILGEKHLPVTLVFLVGTNDTENQKVRAVLPLFEESIKSRYQGAQLQLIELRGNVFDDYVKRYHFSSAIMYKAIIPQAFPHYEHILHFDSGMIFGHRLHDFLAHVEENIRSRTIAPMAAFCVKTELGDLRAELKSYDHNALYPDGIILYFDVARYGQASIYDRFVLAFKLHREQLIYAEQDLLCLILRNGELSEFHECGMRCHIDLASSDWSANEQHEGIYKSRDYFYIKHVGSLKPWKKWVLHPSKAIFLRERTNLLQLLKNGYSSYLRDDELLPANPGFLAQQLVLLEAYYEAH